MKRNLSYIAVTVAAWLFSGGLSLAVENMADVPQKTAGVVKADMKNSRKEFHAKHKPVAKIKLININGATHKELKTLPGIGDAEAAKIIAGRPYASKAWLVSNNIIDRVGYEKINKLIVAIQPYKDGAKNAALYNKKK